MFFIVRLAQKTAIISLKRLIGWLA